MHTYPIHSKSLYTPQGNMTSSNHFPTKRHTRYPKLLTAMQSKPKKTSRRRAIRIMAVAGK